MSCARGGRSWSPLLDRREPPQLVEEVENQQHLVLLRVDRRRESHCEAFAARIEIEVASRVSGDAAFAIRQLGPRPLPRLAGLERLPVHRVVDNVDALAEGSEEELLP